LEFAGVQVAVVIDIGTVVSHELEIGRQAVSPSNSARAFFFWFGDHEILAMVAAGALAMTVQHRKLARQGFQRIWGLRRRFRTILTDPLEKGILFRYLSSADSPGAPQLKIGCPCGAGRPPHFVG